MTDIKQDLEVIRVYWEMMGTTCYDHCMVLAIGGGYICNKCKKPNDHRPCSYLSPITLSVPELAFFMRDKCVDAVGGYKWSYSIDETCYWDMTPEQWIEAACAAWEGKKDTAQKC